MTKDSAAVASEAGFDLRQLIKLVVYSLLLVNFGLYLAEDFSIAAHTLRNGGTLLDYTGAYVIVSHNRSFLDPIVTKVLEFIPNEPPKVKEMSVKELYEKLQQETPLRLIDVRREDEWNTARLEKAELLNPDLMEELLEEPQDTMIVFQCHHGHRSRRAAEQMVAHGYREVYNLEGGIDAWSQEVDSSVPRY